MHWWIAFICSLDLHAAVVIVLLFRFFRLIWYGAGLVLSFCHAVHLLRTGLVPSFSYYHTCIFIRGGHLLLHCLYSWFIPRSAVHYSPRHAVTWRVYHRRCITVVCFLLCLRTFCRFRVHANLHVRWFGRTACFTTCSPPFVFCRRSCSFCHCIALVARFTRVYWFLCIFLDGLFTIQLPLTLVSVLLMRCYGLLWFFPLLLVLLRDAVWFFPRTGSVRRGSKDACVVYAWFFFAHCIAVPAVLFPGSRFASSTGPAVLRMQPLVCFNHHSPCCTSSSGRLFAACAVRTPFFAITAGSSLPGLTTADYAGITCTVLFAILPPSPLPCCAVIYGSRIRCCLHLLPLPRTVTAQHCPPRMPRWCFCRATTGYYLMVVAVPAAVVLPFVHYAASPAIMPVGFMPSVRTFVILFCCGFVILLLPAVIDKCWTRCWFSTGLFLRVHLCRRVLPGFLRGVRAAPSVRHAVAAFTTVPRACRRLYYPLCAVPLRRPAPPPFYNASSCRMDDVITFRHAAIRLVPDAG